MDERWIGTAEAAARAGVSRQSVSTWARTGRFPAVRAGVFLLVEEGPFMAFLEIRGTQRAVALPRLPGPSGGRTARDPDWLSHREAAAVAGVDARAIGRWLRAGLVEGRRACDPVGPRTYAVRMLVGRESLERFLRERDEALEEGEQGPCTSEPEGA